MTVINFHAFNSGHMIDLYERYCKDPASVDPATRSIFNQWHPTDDLPEPGLDARTREERQPDGSLSPSVIADLDKIVAVVNLAQAIRTYGHLKVQLDPLGFFQVHGDASLLMETYGLSEDDLARLPAGIVGGSIGENASNALDAIDSLTKVYATACGYDYSHIHIPAERDWLNAAAEQEQFHPALTPEISRTLLERLTQVEVFEQFLHRFFPGKTRFSIEGEDMLVPMLDEVINSAVEAGICSILIGMPHRGRLNVLAHILSIPYQQILLEFKDPAGSSMTMHERGWTGDVKYHRGGSYAAPGEDEVRIVIGMPPIPSHLELVNPVVSGMARALQSKVGQPGVPELFPNASLPILIHGDASFPGEGIVAESLNLSGLAGYRVSGAIHIIVNNQLGYTTYPDQGRSTLYSSDPAKGFEIPIIHVNADNPQACIEAIRTAFAYRERFHKDFLIDLVGYRRYGHNEGDEPGFTQPALYQKIERQPTIRKIWADRLESRGIVEKGLPEKLVQEDMQILQNTLESLPPEERGNSRQVELEPPDSTKVNTKVLNERLLRLADSLLKVPQGFNLHNKLVRAMDRRRKVLVDQGQTLVDWALAEQLALASILEEGIPIRMTGQDVERGTFSQRHAVFHDVVTQKTYIPLQSIPQARASFEIHNSPLSEAAALAFEYGYNVQEPKRLVIWEAQYGDFINNAQSILDEFILSGRAKWGQQPSLILLLPHGNEGQGPNHSSSRLERFLQMSTEASLHLVNCTTAAQYFHILREQALSLEMARTPLVILTPKSLLRHPLVASNITELTEGMWKPVLDDDLVEASPSKVRRLAFCSGKIAVDLVDSDLRQGKPDVAIIRLEQLCPFPGKELEEVISRYDRLEEIFWVQEEPENMGAWMYISQRLSHLVQDRLPFRYLGRPASSSPSEGSFTRYTINQKDLVNQVFTQSKKAIQSSQRVEKG
jgi:2-oxoglutarate dehydrogenase E1 component